MIRLISFALAMAIAIASLSLSASSQSSKISGKITEVYDGDTITMEGLKIRICGVNSPELRDEGGSEAQAFMSDLVLNKRVKCNIVGSDTPCDNQRNARSYGRIVAQCFVEGSDIAESLVRYGHAADSPKYSGGYYSK